MEIIEQLRRPWNMGSHNYHEYGYEATIKDLKDEIEKKHFKTKEEIAAYILGMRKSYQRLKDENNKEADKFNENTLIEEYKLEDVIGESNFEDLKRQFNLRGKPFNPKP